jgi:hypothetical protein
MNLVVLLKPTDASRKLPQDCETRPSRAQLLALAQETARHVETCVQQVRSVLSPKGIEVRPMKHLNGLLLACPPSADLKEVRKAIVGACADVLSITEDFRLAHIESHPGAAPDVVVDEYKESKAR